MKSELVIELAEAELARLKSQKRTDLEFQSDLERSLDTSRKRIADNEKRQAELNAFLEAYR